VIHEQVVDTQHLATVTQGYGDHFYVVGFEERAAGKLTTAYLTLKLYEEDFQPVVVHFDRIIETVLEGEVDAGLVIHEGQLTYKDFGLKKVVDLGEWWQREYSLPLPLGCNIVRRDLGLEVIRKLEKLMRESIEYSLSRRKEALEYAINYARGLTDDPHRTNKFVGMYVNERTVDYGEDGRRAVRLLLKLGKDRGIIDADIPDIIFSDEV
jgi:1,4-dihydroxy-6-naphthoate synthase